MIFANEATGVYYAWGGGLYGCDGAIQNNVIYRNSAGHYGGGLYECQGAVVNCIIWANAARQRVQLSRVTPTYCCIEYWVEGGEGNIAFNPHFMDPESGDFHLKSWSLCIDAGDPTSPFSKEPEPNGRRVNIGAYGNTPEAACKSPDADGDGLPDDWELLWFGDLQQDTAADPDADGVAAIHEWHYGWDPTQTSQTFVENLTKRAGYQTIQAALSDSDDGDEIVVDPGVYEENINFGGKNIILRSLEPLDSDVVADTVIDGSQAAPVVSFMGSESEACVLSGLTIRNGSADYGGGVSGNGTHATIFNSVITGNVATFGGGLYNCDGMIHNNVITSNSTGSMPEGGGGGLLACNGTIQNNTITGNRSVGLLDCDGTIQNNTIADNFNGGLWGCGGIIKNNTISGNTALWAGGGLSGCHGIIQNNFIIGNWGPGLHYCHGIIRNNTIAGNSGWGGRGCHGAIVNCILWGNMAPEGGQLYESSEPSYSCIEGWTGGGEANISEDPQFVDRDGHDDDPQTYGDNDYRLLRTSPCIDSGVNEDWMWEAVDLDGNPRILHGTVDMGAYEASLETWYVDGSVPVSGDGGSWERAFQTIQEGIDAARAGDSVIVAQWTYAENIQFNGRDITLRSTDPSDPKVVASTIIIDAGEQASVVTFTGAETSQCLLIGFTIRNGMADYGGGICGGTRWRHTHATIRSNTITHNSAAYDGGGLAFCDGIIESNVIIENRARDNGGGLTDCQRTIRNNTIADNSAFYSGGGFFWCHGTIEGNLISNNVAARGGGLDTCNGTIERNTITGNSVSYGGGGLAWCEGIVQSNLVMSNSAYYGGGLAWGEAIIQNNLIVGNWGDDRGGGLEGCDGTVRNNTIVDNAAPDRGGGLADCDAVILNCIIWGNTAAYSAQLSACSTPTYCCIQE